MLIGMGTTGPVRTFILGVTEENLQRLKAGDPIRIDAAHHQGFPDDVCFLILYGKDEETLLQQLAPGMDDATKIHVMDGES